MKISIQVAIFLGAVIFLLIYFHDGRQLPVDAQSENQSEIQKNIKNSQSEPLVQNIAHDQLKIQRIENSEEKSIEKFKWQDREELESLFRKLGEKEIRSQIQNFDFLLEKFSQLNFSEMSEEKRVDFNRLNRLRLFALQRLIMLKHGDLL